MIPPVPAPVERDSYAGRSVCPVPNHPRCLLIQVKVLTCDPVRTLSLTTHLLAFFIIDKLLCLQVEKVSWKWEKTDNSTWGQCFLPFLCLHSKNIDPVQAIG